MSKNNTTVLYKNNTTVFASKNTKVLNAGMSIAKRLRESRKKAGLSQEALADMVSCTQGLISKLERGDQTETALIVEIANAVKVRPEYLLCKDDIENYDDINKHKVEQLSPNYEVKRINNQLNSVPLLSLKQACDHKSALKNSSELTYIHTDATVALNTYAVTMQGDSMAPTFSNGTVIIVDPDLGPVPGDYVIAKSSDDDATIKQLIKDGPDWYLKPENTQYPTKDAGLFDIIGVVIQAQSTIKFK